MLVVWTFLAALALAAVNALPHALHTLRPAPRARFLSFCGGVTIGFVVTRLLPGLGQEAALVERVGTILPLPPGENAYAAALLALLLFSGADTLSRRAAEAAEAQHPAAPVARARAFRVELASFAALDFLIGFTLLHRARVGGHELLFFFVAMLLKFILSDHALHAQHQDAYDRVGRWVLSGTGGSRYGPFFLGAVAYAALLAVV